MNYKVGLSVFCALTLHAADDIGTWFKEGKAQGNIRYYYIDTVKEGGAAYSAQHSNAIGGQLGYTTGSLYGLKLGATFMTTNPFALPNDPSAVDQSIIGRDNKTLSGVVADGNQGFSILGEAYAQYNRDNYEIWYGRKVIQTPLMDAKDVRMLPSAFQGGMGTLKLDNNIEISAGYIDRFKQRTSDNFMNVIQHALGANTELIIGKDEGYVLPVSFSWKNSSVSARVYDYYAPDFMNSVYADATFKNKLGTDVSYDTSIQAMAQKSIGNADTYLATHGGEINAQELGAKVSATYQESTIMAACTHVFSNTGDHDSLVLPWDGTPLYTNMITSNDLFVSNYGKGLESDTAYIGGTTGIKLGVSQKFDFTGTKGFSAGLSYARYENGRFPSDQEDVNGELGYGAGNFSLALKGIWVKNNTSTNVDNTLKTQNDYLTQYRVIANYKF